LSFFRNVARLVPNTSAAAARFWDVPCNERITDPRKGVRGMRNVAARQHKRDGFAGFLRSLRKQFAGPSGVKLAAFYRRDSTASDGRSAVTAAPFKHLPNRVPFGHRIFPIVRKCGIVLFSRC
jgi:hypothetical protein